MHYCEAKIRIAGDTRTVVQRDTFRPISWPEVEILRALHGDDAVVDVKPFVRVERSAKEEKERLRLLYGPVVEDIFPGRNPNMEMEAAGAKLPEQVPLWRDPADRDTAQGDFNPPAEATPQAEKPAKVRTPAPFA
jgi:hypothetical protein